MLVEVVTNEPKVSVEVLSNSAEISIMNTVVNPVIEICTLTQAIVPISFEQRLAALELKANVVITELSVVALPATVDDNTQFLFLNISGMTSDLDITNYTPTGLCKGAICRFKKIDTSPFKIGYTDGGVDYSFVDRRGEYMELIWNGSKLVI